jgi:hypothetical protein
MEYLDAPRLCLLFYLLDCMVMDFRHRPSNSSRDGFRRELSDLQAGRIADKHVRHPFRRHSFIATLAVRVLVPGTLAVHSLYTRCTLAVHSLYLYTRCLGLAEWVGLCAITMIIYT